MNEPTIHQTKLISLSVNMYRTLSELYDSNRAFDIITQFCNSIDDDLKGSIYAAILSNEVTDLVITKIKITEKVSVVRCIRANDCRRLSLRETIDMVNNLIDNNVPIRLDLLPKDIEKVRVILHDLGSEGPGIF